MRSQTSSPAPHARALTALGWAIAVLASAFIAFCTAVGPIYRADASIVDADAGNAMRFVVAFVACMGIVVMMARPRRAADPLRTRMGAAIVRGTDRWWRIALILLVCWAWVPVSLGSAYGYDVTAQIAEFANWWAWLTGAPDAPDYHAAFTTMDVYPIAHYLWPADPTWLTNQHNIVLTLLYGGVAHWLGAGPGLLALSAAQFLFAVFVTAATADRIFQPGGRQPGGRQPGGRHDTMTTRTPRASEDKGAKPGIISAGKTTTPVLASVPPSAAQTATPSRLLTRARAWWNATGDRGPATTHAPTPAGPVARVAALAFLAINPLVWSATISLTKSPLFAFGFLWSFGLWHQLIRTGALPRHGRVALALSTLTMLASAKYGVIVVAVQCVLGLIVLRRHRRLMAVALLVPAIVFQGALAVATSSGAIMGGDPIEGKAIQVQQIARIARRDPDAIPAQARERLERIFDLDAMAKVYDPDDADPAKSSGGEGKQTSYRWRTVTADDMDGFAKAWLAACAAAPVDCWDAFAAEWYGYFDVTDPPYVAQTHYVAWPNEGRVPEVAAYHGAWRARVVDALHRWSATPVLGWLTHANLWTGLTLLAMCAQAVRRRWMVIMTEVPLLMQMAVAAASPANNFERHMLGVVLAFAFVMVASARDARDTRDTRDTHHAAGAAPTTVEP